MINQDIFLRFGAALLIGVLIGMQREYAYSSSKEGGLFAGARTFALMSLFGALAALLADLFFTPWVFIGLIVLLGVMVIVDRYLQGKLRLFWLQFQIQLRKEFWYFHLALDRCADISDRP